MNTANCSNYIHLLKMSFGNSVILYLEVALVFSEIHYMFFDITQNGIIFLLFFFHFFPVSYTKIELIFVYWLCSLRPGYICILDFLFV